MSPAFDVPAIRSRAIDRPRLCQRIGLGDDRANLTIVQGTAGAGKSTALAQWARGLELDGENLVWITLNADDAKALPFWSRIGSALVRNGIVSAESQAAALIAATGVEDAGARLNAAFAAISLPLTIVIDDFHLVDSDLIDAQVRALVELNGNVRIVIGTRTTGALHSLALAARVTTRIIEAAELAFTEEESGALVADSALGNDGTLAHTIFAATLGWPLASQALLIEARRDPGSQRLLARASGQRSLFVKEIVNGLLAARSAESQRFLLSISLADEVTMELACELSGQSAEAVSDELRLLEQDGVGTWQVRSSTAWFRIHPLLLEAMAAASETELPPERIVTLRAQLADWLRHDRPLRALELAVAIADWRRVEDIFCLRFGLLTDYHQEASARLLYGIPRASLVEFPTLVALRLVYEFVAGRTTTERTSQTLEILHRANKGRQLGGASMATVMGEAIWIGAHRLFGDEQTALELSARASDLFDSTEMDDRTANSDSVALFHVQVGIAFFTAGQYLRALVSFEQSAVISLDSGAVNTGIQAEAMISLTHAVRGDIASARARIARSSTEGQPMGIDGWMGKYLGYARRIATVIVHLHDWDAEAADLLLTELEKNSGGLEYWPDLLSTRGWTDLLLSGPAAASESLTVAASLRASRALAPATPRARLSATLAQLLVLGGQPHRALTELQSNGESRSVELDLIRARLSSGRAEGAAALALTIAAASASDEIPRIRAEAQLFLAWSAAESGRDDMAVDAFTTAMSILKKFELRLPLLSVPKQTLRDLVLLSQARGHHVDEGMISSIPSLTHRPVHVEALSNAERRVLRALVGTGDVSVAADALHLSVYTVRYHLKRSYRKLGVSTRSEALATAQHLGLLE